MTPRTVAGYDLLELFFWALDRLGIQPTVTQIRLTLLVLVGLAVLGWMLLAWRRRSRGDKQQKEATMKVAYQSESLYIVTFGEQNGETMGRLVDMEIGVSPGPLVPVGSISAKLPYENFVPFTGDPVPILARVQRYLSAP